MTQKTKKNEPVDAKDNPKIQSPLRWTVIVLSTTMLLSIYYCYDIPSALKTQLSSHMGNSSDYEVQFGLLYSLYSFPNIIGPLVAGMLVDRFGASICLLIFCSIYSFGQLCFAFGIYSHSWSIMHFGRFSLGLGGESFKVANYAILPEWFTRNELAYVNAIASLSRFGNVLVNIISPNLATKYSINIALLPGDCLCLLSIGCVIVLKIFERHFAGKTIADGRSKKKEDAAEFELVPTDSNHGSSKFIIGDADEDEDDEEENDRTKQALSSNSQDLESALDESVTSDRAELLHPQQKKSHSLASDDTTASITTTTSNPLHDDTDEDEEIEGDVKKGSSTSSFSLSSIVSEFDSTYWLMVVSCCCVYACMGPFNNIASTVLLERDYFRPIPTDCQLTDPYQCQSATNPPMASTCPSSSSYQLPLPRNYSIYDPLTAQDIDCTSSYWKDGDCTSDYCHRLNGALEKTSYIMSIPFFLFACTTVFVGKLVDRVGHRLEILLVSTFVFVFTHFSLAMTDVNAIVPMIGQGIGNCLFITTYWPLLPLIVDPKIYGKAYGLAMSLQNCVYVIMPMILARIYTNANHRYIPTVELAFVVASLFSAIPFLYLLFRKYSSSSSSAVSSNSSHRL